jgi:hypothetical protein
MRRRDFADILLLGFAVVSFLAPASLHAGREWAPWAERALQLNYTASTQQEYQDRLRMKEPLENPRERHVSQPARDQYYNQLRQYDTPDYQPPQQMTIGVIGQYTRTLQGLFSSFFGSGSLAEDTRGSSDIRLARPAVHEVPMAGCAVSTSEGGPLLAAQPIAAAGVAQQALIRMLPDLLAAKTNEAGAQTYQRQPVRDPRPYRDSPDSADIQ